MAELTQKELLFLSNLMYVDGAVSEGRTVEEIISDLRAEAIRDPKGFEKKLDDIPASEYVELADKALSDKRLCQLRVEKTTDQGYIKAANFVDPDGEATIAFQGTGGSAYAWGDNAEGLAVSDTACQQTAMDFVNEVARKHKNITVTGHSKGGNMATYVAIVGGLKVDRCVSFDAQGFDDEFMEKYAVQIERGKNKCTQIFAHNDLVSPLLTTIAPTVISVRNRKEKNFGDGHRSWRMLYDNSDTGYGDFGEADYQAPGKRWKRIHWISQKIQKWSKKSGWFEKHFTNTFSFIMPFLVSSDKFNSKAIYKSIYERYSDYAKRKAIPYFTTAVFTIELETIKLSAGCLEEAVSKLRSDRQKIVDICDSITDISPATAVNKYLMKLLGTLCEKQINKLEKESQTLEAIYESYYMTESRICDCGNNVFA